MYPSARGWVLHVRDLDQTERQVLLALAAHLAEADDRIDAAEVLELHWLADELGVEDLMTDLMRARGALPTRDELLGATARVTRQGARDLIRTLLFDLAQADGERSEEERALLDAVTRAWAPTA